MVLAGLPVMQSAFVTGYGAAFLDEDDDFECIIFCYRFVGDAIGRRASK